MSDPKEKPITVDGVPPSVKVVTKRLTEVKFQFGPVMWHGLTSVESAQEFMGRWSTFRARREALAIRRSMDGFLPEPTKKEILVTGIFIDLYAPSIRFKAAQPNITVYEHQESVMLSFPEMTVFSLGNLYFDTPCVVHDKNNADPLDLDTYFARTDINNP